MCQGIWCLIFSVAVCGDRDLLYSSSWALAVLYTGERRGAILIWALALFMSCNFVPPNSQTAAFIIYYLDMSNNTLYQVSPLANWQRLAEQNINVKLSKVLVSKYTTLVKTHWLTFRKLCVRNLLIFRHWNYIWISLILRHFPHLICVRAFFMLKHFSEPLCAVTKTETWSFLDLT